MSHSVHPSRSRFDRNTTAEEVCDGIDLAGKTLLITGVRSGLGLESLRVLAARGAHIIGLARTLEDATAACAPLGAAGTPMACDLSDLPAVARCAQALLDGGQPLDVIMCNAGIMALPELTTRDGLELQFLTNHLGHFVLLNRLLPLLTAAPAGRVVMVSSAAHRHTVKGGINFDNLDGAKGYDPWRFYGQSKLANLLTSNELARRLYGTSATANAVHPGVIPTDLGRHATGVFTRLVGTVTRPVQRTIARGAATQCYVATHRDLRRVSGHYFADCNPARTTRQGSDPELARRLWEVSTELAADYL